MNRDLLKYMACPKCHCELTKKNDKIQCKQCGQWFEIQDGIPIMLLTDYKEKK